MPITEPAIEAFTTSISPALSANMPMMSSVALPNVAFKSPPMAGDVLLANSSVRLADKLGERKNGDRREKKHDTGDTPAKEAPIASGTKSKEREIYEDPFAQVTPEPSPAGGRPSNADRP